MFKWNTVGKKEEKKIIVMIKQLNPRSQYQGFFIKETLSNASIKNLYYAYLNRQIIKTKISSEQKNCVEY